MGIFGQSAPFDADIEKATSEKHTNENWSLILDVCDKVTSNSRHAKDCLKSIMRRMGHADPHIVMQAITLLDACVNNCGKPFHLEIASREFTTEFRRLLTKAQPKVSARMCQVLKSWADGDFKNDAELNLIPHLYQELRTEGYEFSNSNEKPKSATRATISKDPNVVSSQQEEDDIAKAIELSLKETKNSPKQQTAVTTSSGAYPSLYPSVTGGSTVTTTVTAAASAAAAAAPAAAPAVEPRKVRALYDFEAAEDNELTFYAGEIIHVVDDSDPNWWKGLNQRGEGLFPSNFVTADLSVDPERLDLKAGKSKGEESVEQKKEESKAPSNQRIEVDEGKIDRLLHLLHEANPEDPSEDSEEMLRLEQEVNQMGPLIDTELERVDRKHAQLTQLSSDLVDAINMYHSLMRDDRAAMLGAPGHYMLPAGMPNSNIGMHPAMMFGAGAGGGAYGNPGMSGNFSTLPQMPMLPPVSNGGMPQYHAQGVVPMHYQNGHASNGNAPTMNVLPQMLFAQQQQHLQQQAINQPQQQQQPQQSMYVTAPQQQQQQQQQLPPPTPPIQQPGMPVFSQQQQQAPQTQYMPAEQQQHTQFISSTAPPPQQQPLTQLQQQQQPQPQPQPQPMPNFIPQQGTPQHQQQAPYVLPNGGQPYMPTAPSNGALSAEQFSQFQQQMAAISLGVGNNQPVTQNFLVQNESKNNIPIYQQQR